MNDYKEQNRNSVFHSDSRGKCLNGYMERMGTMNVGFSWRILGFFLPRINAFLIFRIKPASHRMRKKALRMTIWRWRNDWSCGRSIDCSIKLSDHQSIIRIIRSSIDQLKYQIIQSIDLQFFNGVDTVFLTDNNRTVDTVPNRAHRMLLL